MSLPVVLTGRKVPSGPPWIIRVGTLSLSVDEILRCSGRNGDREARHASGRDALADVQAIALIADASRKAMGGEYRPVTEGAALVLSIVCRHRLIDWINDRWLRSVLQPSPLHLIKNGKLLRVSMRQEMIAPDELFSELRKQGLPGS